MADGNGREVGPAGPAPRDSNGEIIREDWAAPPRRNAPWTGELADIKLMRKYDPKRYWSAPLQQLGQLSALGVFVGCCLSIFILPILLSTFKNTFFLGANRALQEILNSYAKTIERGRSYALVTSVVFAAVCSGVFFLEIDDDFVKYFDRSTDFRKNTDRATELLAGPNHIEVLVASSQEHGVFDPSYLSYLKDLEDYLRQAHG